MAATSENTEIIQKEDERSGIGNTPWKFPKLPFFPFFKPESKKPEIEANDPVKTQKTPPPTRVVLANRQNPPPPPNLNLEVEETVGRTSNPVVLWQVYILGGFLILKWAWTRWNERKDGGEDKGSSDDDHRSPADDEYSQTQ